MANVSENHSNNNKDTLNYDDDVRGDANSGNFDENSKTKCSYENPNYRQLYAKLSMDAMIGIKNKNEPSNTEEDSNNNNEDDCNYDQYDYEDDSLDEEYEDIYDEEENVKENLLKNSSDTKPKVVNNISLDLPDGWERHEDELGSYFWHIPTGTIQRERPFLDTIDKSMIRSDSLIFLDKSAINVDYNPADSIEENPDAELKEEQQQTEDEDEEKEQKKSLITRKKIIANMQLTFTDDEDDLDEIEKELTFMVHSLGWLDVEESQINCQTGSMVIKRCIYELSTRAEHAAGCWGPNDTQSLIFKMNGERILLLEPNTSTTLSIQLIREIRMWAVDDNNNFAYVVKERKSSKPGMVKCHVFHCDEQENNQTAEHIAIYLKDALVRIKNQNKRPNDLVLKSNIKPTIDNFEFPTPIEEPKKNLSALYIGFVPVSKPMGVDILNMAIDEVVNSLKMSLTNENNNETELMRPVTVNISPSNIVVECRDTGATLVECRVRYIFC